ncbi:MAG: S41 family peptidase [Gammaproteobacteria bacterium]|nr:S41 family peptidase [Gammaproteobacteria bacterium]
MPKIPVSRLLIPALLLAVGALGHAVIAKTDGQASVSLQELRNFSEAFALIKRQYVDEVDDSTLMRNAMRGMASKLDPYTTYLDREELDDWEVTTSGEFGGLGIVVSKDGDDSAIKVVSPIDDTPAKRAGILSGDLILELDGEPVHDLSLHDAVQIMRGKPGTPIALTVSRKDVEEPFEVSITRAIIKVQSVRGQLLEPGYAYLRISNFQTRTSTDFMDHLEKLQDESDEELQGIVLDLRNNPGGLFTASVEISDTFLPHNRMIVSTRGRTHKSNVEEHASGGDQTGGVPVVVLINGGSASASEIVAGALRDNGRAKLLGSRSFGKGSVQTLVPLNNQNAALKLTTARYYTPSGHSIHEKGIEPDYEVEFVAPEKEDSEAADKSVQDAIFEDNQVQAALELLKYGKLSQNNQEARSE